VQELRREPACGKGCDAVNELDDVQTTIGVIDGLRSRIAALEAEVNARDLCIDAWQRAGEQKDAETVQAEAELAERDRTIETLVTAASRGSCDMSDGCPPNHGGLYPDAKFCEGCTLGPLLIDLRARAEKEATP